MAIVLRELVPGDGPAADAIMRSLPEWFGHEGGLAACAVAVREGAGWALERDFTLVAFATWEPRNTYTAEITWMGVHSSVRGQQLGTRLIEYACAELRARGYALALAMTSAAPKIPTAGTDPYDATRAFWLRRGFLPLAELDIWDTDIALLVVRPLQTLASSDR